MTETTVNAGAAVQVTEYWVVEVDRHDGTCRTFDRSPPMLPGPGWNTGPRPPGSPQ